MAATTEQAAAQTAETAKKQTRKATKRVEGAAKNAATTATATTKPTTKRTTKRTAGATTSAAAATASAAKRATKRAAAATKDAATSAATATERAATTAKRATSTVAKQTPTTSTTRTTSTTGTTSAAPTMTVTEAIAANKPTIGAVADRASAATGNMFETAAAKATAVIESFPSIDFTNLDRDSLKQLDPRKIEWNKIERPQFDRQKLLDAVRDAAYVTVGFGVLAVQRAQVQRRELAAAISDRFGANRHQVEQMIAAFETRLTKIDDAVEARVDHALGMIGERLPDQAETLLHQVNSVAKTARRQVRGMLLSNAA
jgi:hypothetical protein